MIYNGVEQKLVADRPRDADPFSSDQILFDAIANHAHRDVLAYTKLKFSIASATPRPLWALDSRKLHPLLCVVPAPTLHASPMWVLQNVEPSSLSLPTGEHIFHSKFTYDLSHGCPLPWVSSPNDSGYSGRHPEYMGPGGALPPVRSSPWFSCLSLLYATPANSTKEDCLAIAWELSRAELSDAELSHVELSRAELSHRELLHAELSHADVSCAELSLV